MTVEKTKYVVLILKRNEDHISVIETEDFEEADKEWKALKDQWTLALKEQVPFELRKPLVTAFDPGLIYEVTLRPIEVATRTNVNNPYQQEMQKNGFSNTFRSYAPKGADLLDGGYKA